VSGVNQSKEYPIVLEKQTNGTYKYQNNNFFPINGQLFGNYSNNKNFHFTYELHTQFTYKGGETFIFSGDDDVWVYINGKKVIDLGGVHGSQTQNVNLDSLGLTAGQSYDLDFFFAERHTTESNFTITTNIALEPAPSPDGDEDRDGITNLLEGYNRDIDSNNDGTPDYLDIDSDNNGVPDQVEVGGNPASPTDSDSDNIANFRDTDDDGNGRDDEDEIGSDPQNPTNTDGEDLPDYQDLDDDNDAIVDRNELGSNPQSPIDTDQDGTKDYQDTDSDGDTLPDSEEGIADSPLDQDSIPNYLDRDSDGDSLLDVNEKNADFNGDEVPDIADSNGDEVKNTSDLTSPKTIADVDGDGKENYLDRDSDGDGTEEKGYFNEIEVGREDQVGDLDYDPEIDGGVDSDPYVPNTAD
jgi:fibro-slime domain-containing protein